MQFYAQFAAALIYLYIGRFRDLGTVPAQVNRSSTFVARNCPHARDDVELFLKSERATE